MTLDFDSEELALLGRALDALENEPQRVFMISTMLSAVTADSREAREAAMEKEKREFEQDKPERDAISESVLLVKAKLVGRMRELRKSQASDVLADAGVKS